MTYDYDQELREAREDAAREYAEAHEIGRCCACWCPSGDCGVKNALVAAFVARASAEVVLGEPPFNRDHHMNHVPARGVSGCPNCRWLNWTDK